MLLIGCLEGAQTADLLENALRIELVLKPLQSAIYWLTFANITSGIKLSLLV